jgi:hypothetical protein
MTIAVVVISLGMFFLVVHFTPKSEEIVLQQQQLPESSAAAGTMGETKSAWQQFYNLEFTGEGIVPTGVAFDDENKVAFLDSSVQKLVVLDVKQKSFQAFVLPDEATTRATAVAYHGGDLYLYAGAVFTYNVGDRAWKKLTPDFDFAHSPTLLANFAGNFYLLGENLIRRLNFDGKGNYLSIDVWLNENEEEDLQPLDVYLDGYVYLSDVRGGVTRYLRGEAENWRVKDTPKGQIYLTGTQEKLFYLARDVATVYQFTKDGTLERQFSDEILRGGRFLWYVPESDTFFTMVEEVIYSFTPENN